jgi:hypothetical protein
MNYQVDTTMATIIARLNEDRLIEAIKTFRTAYACGLREAKDACEAIKAAIAAPAVVPDYASNAEFIVLNRPEYDYDYRVARDFVTQAGAMAYADERCAEESVGNIIVARVVAESVIKRTMVAK